MEMARHVEKIIKRRPEEVGKRAFKAGDHGFCGDKEIRRTDKNSQLENSGVNPYFCESHGSGVGLAAFVPGTAPVTVGAPNPG
jgi:hypothetical protein